MTTSATERDVLIALGLLGTADPGTIAAWIRQDIGTVTRALRRLVEAGLIEDIGAVDPSRN